MDQSHVCFHLFSDQRRHLLFITEKPEIRGFSFISKHDFATLFPFRPTNILTANRLKITVCSHNMLEDTLHYAILSSYQKFLFSTDAVTKLLCFENNFHVYITLDEAIVGHLCFQKRSEGVFLVVLMAVFSNTEIADHSGLGSVLLSFAEESAILLSNEAGSHLPLYVAVAYYFYNYRKFLASLFFGRCQPPEEVLDYACSLKVTLLELKPGEHENS
jgi:hypothetical protein